jgi:lysophospholipase L1-like esterase
MEEDGSFRYYKALTVGELCLKCHGPLEDLEPDVRRSLRENYPGDLALGYALGDFRGSIRVAIPREAADQGEVVFLGNSITYGGDWNGMFPSLLIKNRGISGDVTQGVLDRLDRVLETRPAKIFLMIGINDLAFGRNEEEILANIKRIIREIRQGSPETILYLQSLLPVNPDYPVFSNHTDKGLQIKNINRVLRRMAGDYGAVFVDLYPLFVGQDDKLDPRYTKDGLHLTAAGYSVWEKAVAPHLE